MELQVADSILSHWKTLIAIWIGINFVLAMPPPGKKGAPDTWWYNMLYSALHTIAGGLPRLAFALFPQSWVAKLLGGNGSASNGATTPTAQGTVK